MAAKNLIDLSDAPYALQTYYNYVAAWVECCEQLYGKDDDLWRNLSQNFQGLKSIQKMQGGQSLNDDIINNYWRGNLTLKAMTKFPIDTHKELAQTANLWLPVQAYYAIHGIGISCITSLGYVPSTSHKAFMASFSDLCRQYLPAPFNSLCNNGPTKDAFIFHNLDTTPDKVSQQSNLSNPRYSDINAVIGKCLSSTRYKLLQDKFSKVRKQNIRPGRKRRKLNIEEKQSICRNLHSTSVIDFLYRMRIRSNYEEPDIYLLDTDINEAATHYERLCILVQLIIYLLEEILKRKIGKESFKRLTENKEI